MHSFKSLVLISLVLLSYSCGSTKQSNFETQMAANRTMGLFFKSLTVNGQPIQDDSLKSYFSEQIRAAITDTYGSQTRILDLESDALESPSNLYEIGRTGIDDLFTLNVDLPEDFGIPAELSPEEIELRNQQEAMVQEKSTQVEFDMKVLNGGRLRTVTILKFAAAVEDKVNFETNILQAFRKAALEQFSNPNIYPLNNPTHFADLLFIYSENAEKAAEGRLTCQNSREVLETYSRALELYQLGKVNRGAEAVGSQEEAHALNSKIETSEEKSRILDLCSEDAAKAYELIFTFSNIEPSNQDLIKQAFDRGKTQELLKKYTDKPVNINITASSSGEISIDLKLRYDAKRFFAWTKERTPPVYKGYHMVSTEPYHAIMQTMVYVRQALPAGSPKNLQSAMATASMTLTLSTLLGGEARVAVDGRYIAERKVIDLFYPNKIALNLPGYETRDVFTKSNEIFQEKGWISLGSCRTIDGSLTEDGLLLRFFGLPCKI